MMRSVGEQRFVEMQLRCRHDIYDVFVPDVVWTWKAGTHACNTCSLSRRIWRVEGQRSDAEGTENIEVASPI